MSHDAGGVRRSCRKVLLILFLDAGCTACKAPTGQPYRKAAYRYLEARSRNLMVPRPTIAPRVPEENAPPLRQHCVECLPFLS